MTGLEILNRELSLPGEWFLGGGSRALWAPAFPTMLDQPGFRDPGSYNGQSLDPVFAITLLDRDGLEIPLRAQERHWTPARLELTYRLQQVLITERRTVLAMDTFVCQWTMTHADNVLRHFWIVLWTRRGDGVAGHLIGDIEANRRGITFQESRLDASGRELASWGTVLGASFDADSWSVNRTGSVRLESSNWLRWECSPLYDLMAPGGLPGHLPSSASSTGELYFGLAYPFEIPPGERLIVTFVAACAPDVEQARANLERSVFLVNPIQTSEEDWINWFEDVPNFTCSDPYLQRLYWYRWAQRRLEESTGDSDGERLGPGTVIDGSWHHCSDRGQMLLRQLTQRSAVDELPVGLAARKVLACHPDPSFQRDLGDCLLRVGEESDGPLDARPQREDEAPSSPLARLVFARDLADLLAWLCPEDASRWSERVRCLEDRLIAQFWDDASDFPTESGEWTAYGFLTLFSSAIDPARRRRLLDRLADPAHFWTLYPVPMLSRNDPDFSPEGLWQNQRLDNPRHGRVWPEVTSLVIDAIGLGIERASADVRILLAELVDRAARLTFEDGDLDRPAFYRHYSPITGRPARFLGREFRGGAWWIDHLLRYLVGVRPSESGTVIVDPLPTRMQWFSVRQLMVGAHELEIDWDQRTGLSVRIDEEPAYHVPIGKPLTITLAAEPRP